MGEGGGPIRGLSQIIFCPKNPLLCGVIAIIYLLPIEMEHPQIQIGLPLTWYPL